MAKKPDPPQRKTVLMRTSVWRDINKVRESLRLTSEAEALRAVVEAGLRSLGVRV